MKIIKQYGLMRSGTCFTREFVHANFAGARVVANVLGWKHGPYRPETSLKGKSWLGDWNKPNTASLTMHSRKFVKSVIQAFENGNLSYVVTVRNPYTWVVAVSKYKSFNLTGVRIRNQMRHWNCVHRQWLEEIPEPVCFVRYEALRDKPAQTKARVGNCLGLSPRAQLKVPRLYSAPGVDYGRMFREKTKYIQKFNAKLLDVANKTLDPELMKRFGYDFIREPVR